MVVRLEFVLPEARRLFLIVRGPAPSCRVVGVVPIRGREGENVVRFGGRVRGRPLESGVYRLTISPQRRVVPGSETEFARVVSRRRTVPLPESARKPSCPAAAALAADPTARLLTGEERTAAPPTGAPTPAQQGAVQPSAPLRPPLQVPRIPSPGGSLPDIVPEPGPLAPGGGEDGFGGAAALAVLAAVGLLLLTMLVLVTRFLRGTWNP